MSWTSTDCDELRGISATETHIVIGARTTWTDVLRADLPPAFDALKQAAREVGSMQIQNCGTVAGNLCNASPAADGVPPLLTLDAEVELRSTARQPAFSDLAISFCGNRKTALGKDELVTAIRDSQSGDSRRVGIPEAGRAAISGHFHRHGCREARCGCGRKGWVAAMAVGSCSAVAQRLKQP